MKSQLALLIIGIVAFSVSANDKKDVKEIKDMIQLFVESGDKQDSTLLEGCLLPQAVHFVPSEKGITVLDYALYSRLLEAKKIGGYKRMLKIHNIELDGNGLNAVARVELKSKVLIFSQFISLSKIKTNEANYMANCKCFNFGGPG